jgi:hypothetical protein
MKGKILNRMCLSLWKVKKLLNNVFESAISLNSYHSVITQWVVLAVRNLCEGNADNQALIAALSQEGDPKFLQDGPIRLQPEANGAMRVSFCDSSS